MKQIPLLTNKDVKRINGKLVVVVPDGCGGFTPLQSKDTTPSGGLNLLDLANSQIASINAKLRRIGYWKDVADLIGCHLFDYAEESDELNWRSVKPNSAAMVSSLSTAQCEKEKFKILLSLQLYFGGEYLERLSLNPVRVESFVLLNKKERMIYFKFIASL